MAGRIELKFCVIRNQLARRLTQVKIGYIRTCASAYPFSAERTALKFGVLTTSYLFMLHKLWMMYISTVRIIFDISGTAGHIVLKLGA